MHVFKSKGIFFVVLFYSLSSKLCAMHLEEDSKRSSVISALPKEESNREDVRLSIQQLQKQDEERIVLPPQEKKERVFIKIIREISEKHGIKMFTFTHDWSVHLEKDSQVRFIHYYDFDINSAASYKVCKDKTSTAAILKFKGIPHIEHEMFLHPSLKEYLPPTGVWQEIQSFCETYNYNVVVKPTDSSGGINVFHTSDIKDLENIVHELFMKKGDLAISPFYKIDFEYRAIMLNGQPQLTYRKVIPYVTGDGNSDLKTLFIRYLESIPVQSIGSFLKGFDAKILNSNQVLAQGEKLPLKWKHNLEQGALVNLDIDEEKKQKIEQLAKLAASSLNISFASVDIAEIDQELKVMEVNAGVMMKYFMSQMGERGYDIAKSIYEKAICSGFNLDVFAD